MIAPYSIYSGAGNTFLFFDNRREQISGLSSTWINLLCQEALAKQVDGVILVCSSKHADFRMRIFNIDGSEAEMCGNGLRSLFCFLEELGEKRPRFLIESKASCSHGLHEIKRANHEIEISLGSPQIYHWHRQVEGFPLSLSHLNTGVPHVVFFLPTRDELEAFPLQSMGAFLRFHPDFSPQGTNVNAVAIEKHSLYIRTYERGVEGETLACGTGITASAIAASFHYNLPPLSK